MLSTCSFLLECLVFKDSLISCDTTGGKKGAALSRCCDCCFGDRSYVNEVLSHLIARPLRRVLSCLCPSVEGGCCHAFSYLAFHNLHIFALCSVKQNFSFHGFFLKKGLIEPKMPAPKKAGLGA